jgi:hypothetical protein
MTTIQPADPAMAATLERLARQELSFRARLGYVLLSLVASAMTIVVVSLWATEAALPARTEVAFGLLSAIGVSWAAYSVWVLRARRVMLAIQRVVAGRLAVAFSGVFAAGCLILVLTTDVAAAGPALAMGVTLLVIAVVSWRRAEADCAALRARRDELERAQPRGAR